MHQGLEPGIEVSAPPEDSRGEFVGQAAIGVAERGQAPVERLVEWNALVYRAEDGPGGPPGRQAGGSPSGHPAIPDVGLDGTATSRRGIRPAR